ncbi:hypothetical protein ACIBQ1_54025 [Nonomuraea sp. NPDC050153]|uniref:hypothetical protein n=1 Tax=Nonomuraea sp. NPDC050153 TaxID=3364359 RepID=UPI00379A7AC8
MGLTRYPLTEFEQSLANVAVDRGYESTHLLKYVCELSHPASRVTIYLDRMRALRRVIEVMIHPETAMAVLATIETVHGLSINSALCHNSNLRRFPKRLNKGVKEIAFARSVECADVTAFNRLLQTLTAS